MSAESTPPPPRFDPRSCVIGALIVVVILLIVTRPSPVHVSDEDNMRKLLRQAARWSSAAKQDNSPLIAVLHATYGTGYWDAFKELYTREQYAAIETRMTYDEFEKQVRDTQDTATRLAVKHCPDYAPALDALAKIAGEA